MQSRPVDRYVKLGTGLRYLIDIEPGSEIHGDGLVLQNIDDLLAGLERLGFVVSVRGADDVRAIRERLGALPYNARLSADDRDELFTAVNELYPIVRAEAGGMVAFIVTDKRTDVQKLLGDVRALLAPGVFDILPEIARYDIEEGGKCIAFERPTAAAFHLLRATEAVLRWTYREAVPTGGLNPLLWHPVLEALRKLPSKPPGEMLDNLDYIRRSFRNPTQHPEKIYDIYEAQDLAGLCFDSISRMARHVAHLRAAGQRDVEAAE